MQMCFQQVSAYFAPYTDQSLTPSALQDVRMTFAIIQRAWRPIAREQLTRALFSDSSIDVSKTSSCAEVSERTGAPRPESVKPHRTSIEFLPLARFFTTQRVDDPCALWYVLTAAALLAFHKEALIGELWRYLSAQCSCEKTQLALARRLREACLKSSVLVGFPRVGSLPP